MLKVVFECRRVCWNTFQHLSKTVRGSAFSRTWTAPVLIVTITPFSNADLENITEWVDSFLGQLIIATLFHCKNTFPFKVGVKNMRTTPSWSWMSDYPRALYFQIQPLGPVLLLFCSSTTNISSAKLWSLCFYYTATLANRLFQNHWIFSILNFVYGHMLRSQIHRCLIFWHDVPTLDLEKCMPLPYSVVYMLYLSCVLCISGPLFSVWAHAYCCLLGCVTKSLC